MTADLSADPEIITKNDSIKNVSANNTVESRKSDQPIEINEDTIDRLLFLLHEADPADPSQDSEEMLRLEDVVNQMSPLIDSELERVDRKHAQLTQLSSDLIDTINLYHSLMRETERVPMGMFNNYQQMYGQSGMYNNNNSYRMPAASMIQPVMCNPINSGPINYQMAHSNQFASQHQNSMQPSNIQQHSMISGVNGNPQEGIGVNQQNPSHLSQSQNIPLQIQGTGNLKMQNLNN